MKDKQSVRVAGTHKRAEVIPRDAFALANFQLANWHWENFTLPINLVFNNNVTGKATTACASPADATESRLTMENWQTIVAENPTLRERTRDG